jgi:hypothetical protein
MKLINYFLVKTAFYGLDSRYRAGTGTGTGAGAETGTVPILSKVGTETVINSCGSATLLAIGPSYGFKLK